MTDKLDCPSCYDELILPGKVKDTQVCVCRNPDCKYDGWHFPVEIIQQIIDGKKAQEDLECMKHNYSVLSEQKEIAYKNYLKITCDLQKQLQKAQDALKVANKAIDCAERFLLGVQDKKIEMQKATRTSHLLLFQMPAMAALCLNTINDYKNEITSITK